jgi:hypothetical protein
LQRESRSWFPSSGRMFSLVPMRFSEENHGDKFSDSGRYILLCLNLNPEDVQAEIIIVQICGILVASLISASTLRCFKWLWISYPLFIPRNSVHEFAIWSPRNSHLVRVPVLQSRSIVNNNNLLNVIPSSPRLLSSNPIYVNENLNGQNGLKVEKTKIKMGFRNHIEKMACIVKSGLNKLFYFS